MKALSNKQIGFVGGIAALGIGGSYLWSNGLQFGLLSGAIVGSALALTWFMRNENKWEAGRPTTTHLTRANAILAAFADKPTAQALSDANHLLTTSSMPSQADIEASREALDDDTSTPTEIDESKRVLGLVESLYAAEAVVSAAKAAPTDEEVNTARGVLTRSRIPAPSLVPLFVVVGLLFLSVWGIPVILSLFSSPATSSSSTESAPSSESVVPAAAAPLAPARPCPAASDLRLEVKVSGDYGIAPEFQSAFAFVPGSQDRFTLDACMYQFTPSTTVGPVQVQQVR